MTNSSYECLSIIVIGRVQGVFFRKYTYDQANDLGIKGFVKNKHDGSVYIEAEGTKEQLKLFLNWCKIGSPMSHVENIIKEKIGPKSFKDFQIKY